MRIHTLAVILLAFPVSSAAAQGPDSYNDLDELRSDQLRYAWTEVSLGAAELAGGGTLLRVDDDLALGAAIPLVGLGAVDLVVGSVHAGQGAFRDTGDLDSELGRLAATERRMLVARKIRVGTLLGGGGVAALGAYFGSRFTAGLGLGVATHSVFRLLIDSLALRATAERRERLSHLGLGLDVLPTARGTVAVATVSGTL